VYPHWELVAVDDGSTDGTRALLAELAAEDDRIVVISQPHHGAGAARNAGLSAASGDIVCYLDDDNTMQPLWLKAVAWSFERHHGLELLYGARVKDSEASGERGHDTLPHVNFDPFDRARLEAGNYIDLGVIAHRRDLPEARFDETLKALGDWDLLLRLTIDREPLALPVVAMIYSTSAPDRITRSGHQQQAAPIVRAKLMRRQSA
jgi:glycosyltransferase involved in cell wall biosynthesis